jgi:hypothetical protein
MATSTQDNRSQTTLKDQETRHPTPVLVNDEKPINSSSSSSHNGDNTAVANTPQEALDVVDEKKEVEVEGDEEIVYITGLPFWLIIVALCLAVFVLAIGMLLRFPRFSAQSY